MQTFLALCAMIGVFLIYWHIYKAKTTKHKDYDEITNFDASDDTIFDNFTAHTNADYREEYKNSYYYKYLRSYSLGFQDNLKRFINIKYLEIIDDMLEQSGRKYNMKAIEFISSLIISFVSITVILKIFMVPLHYSVLGGLLASYVFPINDVIIEPRKKRKKKIKLELPNAMDFFYILMKAGNSFDESLKEIAHSSETPLTMEFRRIIEEIENKKIPTLQAYNNSARRVNLESYTNFIKAIQASQDLGADIVENIKLKSNDLKAEYMNEKEKKIEKLEGKIIIPIVVFFMPPVIFIFFGPQIYDMLSGML